MGGGFLVDVSVLEQLITTLSEAAERMHVANDRLRAATASDLGGIDLDHAAGDFQAERFGLPVGDTSAAKVAESLTVLGLNAAGSGAQHTSIGFFRSPDDPHRPVSVVLTASQRRASRSSQIQGARLQPATIRPVAEPRAAPPHRACGTSRCARRKPTVASQALAACSGS